MILDVLVAGLNISGAYLIQLVATDTSKVNGREARQDFTPTNSSFIHFKELLNR